MERRIPRILIAGTGSGCGKTTVTCGILQALADRELRVGAFKCGPDYIDPMFHGRITGRPGTNLDPFFFDGNTLRALLGENAVNCRVSVIEGVMGYYDGIGYTSEASTWKAAARTETPAVLVVNARGMAASVLSVIEGFLRFEENSMVRGVILNQCSPMTYPGLKKAMEARFSGRILPLGYLPPMKDCTLESRHLGLVTAAEVEDLQEKLQKLSAQVERSIDIQALLTLADSAKPLSWEPAKLPEKGEPVRLAVARDKAFCFYYEDSLQVLRRLGAELVDFSPMEDGQLPDNIQGLYLGGGYPELYGQALGENRSMCRSIRQALERGLPCIAECGGFMYLQQSVGAFSGAGYFPGKAWDTGKLCRFGYVTLTAKQDNLLCRAGEQIRAHEFHHWDCTDPGSAFRAEKPTGRAWDCVVATDTLYAGYPHFHFASNPQFAVRFYQAMTKEKHRND